MGISSDLEQEPMDGIGELIRKVAEGKETVFDLSTDLEGTRKIAISHRELAPELPQAMPVADIARAKARSHVFNDVGAFAKYLSRCAVEDNSLILADVNQQVIVAVLDESHQTDREQVTLKAVQHPLFTPWSGLLNRPLKVMDFSLFIMQNRRAITEPDGRELALIFQQIKMSKSITVNQGQGTKSLNGVMVDVEIAGTKKGVALDLPESLSIHVPLFVGTGPQTITIDLLVTPGQNDDVVVYCTASDVEAAKMAAFEEMLTTIGTETGMLVGFGKIEHREWDTVPFQKK